MSATTIAPPGALAAIDAAMRRRGLILHIQLVASGRVRARAEIPGMGTDHLKGEAHGDDLTAAVAGLARDLHRQGL